MSFCYFIFIFISLTFVDVVQSKFVSGELRTLKNWQFITRFCFMSEKGTLQYEFEYPEDFKTQNLLLYWDHPALWASVYRSHLTCEMRQEKLRRDYLQIFPLDSILSGCKNFNGTISCHSQRIPFATARDRWWFLVISNCAATKGMKLSYKLWMRNGVPGDVFFEHFSADEFYILQTDISFLLLEVAVLVVVLVFAVMLHKKGMFHSTYHMFTISVCFRCAYLFFSCIRWGVYGKTGEENMGLRYFAEVLAAISFIIFVLMLLLMALGYTIVCGRLPTWMFICLLVFMMGLAVTYIVLFVYEAVVFDPGWVLYRYESQPGLGIVGLFICCWVVFMAGGLFTLVVHKRKRDFFIPFMCFFTLWFWAVPTLVFVSIWHIPLYMRMKVVNGVENTIICLGHLFYLFLTRPMDSNHNFPYHIRTQQIDTVPFEEATTKALDEAEENENRFTPDIFMVDSNPPAGRHRPHPQPQPVRANGDAGLALTSPGSPGAALGNGDVVGAQRDAPPAADTPAESSFYVPRNLDALFSFPSGAH